MRQTLSLVSQRARWYELWYQWLCMLRSSKRTLLFLLVLNLISWFWQYHD